MEGAHPREKTPRRSVGQSVARPSLNKTSRLPTVLERFRADLLTDGIAPGLSVTRCLHPEPHNPRSQAMACPTGVEGRVLAGHDPECPAVCGATPAPGARVPRPPDMQIGGRRFLPPDEGT